MAFPPRSGQAATASKSRAQKPFPPKKVKQPPPQLPPQQQMPVQQPNAAGIAQQILGPRSVRGGGY